MEQKRSHVFLLFLSVVLLTLSGIHPYERSTWLMEVAPIFIAWPILIATYRRFPLTTFLYLLILLHASILMVGGAYTYARVPLGFWLQDLFSFSRNHYDRIGHFFQGFVPTLVAREVLLRNRFVSNRPMAGFVSFCMAMTVSALYELVEWGAATILGQGADAFLGTQGDVWDTQWDMFMCLIGSVTATVTLATVHDRQMAKCAAPPTVPLPRTPPEG